MLIQRIALVPEAGGISPSELARVSAALQTQITRDLGPSWNIVATIDAFPRLEDLPAGYWPIIVTPAELGSEAGMHIDREGQPYARVEASQHWSLDASRACLEMLVNPFGNRTAAATSLRSDQGPAEFLVELCGPCGDKAHAYLIDDVIVSDFCMPAFFSNGPTSAAQRFSFNGSAKAPLQLLPGGHITWHDLASDSWWLRSHWGDNPIDTKLGAVGRNLVAVRELTRLRRPLRLQAGDVLDARVALTRQHAHDASLLRAGRLRTLLGSGSDVDREAALSPVRPDSVPPWAALLPGASAAQPSDARIIVDMVSVELEEQPVLEQPEPMVSAEASDAAQEAAQVVRVVSVPPPLRPTTPRPGSLRAPTLLSSLPPVAPRERAAPMLALAALVVAAGVALFSSTNEQDVSAKGSAAPAVEPVVSAPVPSAPVVAPVAEPVSTPSQQPTAAVASSTPPAVSPRAVGPVVPATVLHARRVSRSARTVATPRAAASASPVQAAAASIDDLIDTRR